MNWDDLRIFLTVSRSSRLDRASAVLKQDATTISRRIRRLEHDLGQTLFERTRRGHVLTDQGEALARQIEDMESVAVRIQAHAGQDRTLAGKIRLGVTEGFGTQFIAPALSGFASAWPAIEIDLITLSGFLSVPKREVDMSILLTRPRAGRLKVRKLTDYTLQLYAHRNYLANHDAITEPRDLEQHTLIGYVDDLIYSPQLRYFGDILPGITPRLCSPSILAQLELTRSGSGLCILPKFIAGAHEELEVVLPEQVQVTRSFWLVTHEDVQDFVRIRHLSDFLYDLAAKERARLI
ncbi:MAG: LysR family transcriptional regulator [Hyphomonas sp.]|uniref:LysR family transcriptional regulator n=1 Tax=Hyphomonas sp. TaxID=87 RepID=UPI003528107B